MGATFWATLARLKDLALLSTSGLLLWGCGTILGLNEYEIDDAGDGDSSGGMSGDGDGDTGGTSGDGDTGGMSGDGDMGGRGSQCEEDCDDENECTIDSCIAGECAHTTAPAGDSCDGGVCNGVSGAAACVRCLDDAPDEDQDSGCPEGAPVCDTAGIPTCTGCSTHADCADDNECTDETCTPAGVCMITAEAAGTTCTGGVCNGIADGERKVRRMCQRSNGRVAGCRVLDRRTDLRRGGHQPMYRMRGQSGWLGSGLRMFPLDPPLHRRRDSSLLGMRR